MWFRFKYQDTEIELTPEAIKDIRKQLTPQIREIPFGNLVETVRALGLSPRNVVTLFKKMKEAKKELWD